MEAPTLIPLVICNPKGIAEEPHPMGARPTKPHTTDFKKDEKYQEALAKYLEDDTKWVEINQGLKRYTIVQMKCVSGLMVNAKVLHYQIGYKINAEVLPDGTVIDDGFKYK